MSQKETLGVMLLFQILLCHRRRILGVMLLFQILLCHRRRILGYCCFSKYCCVKEGESWGIVAFPNTAVSQKENLGVMLLFQIHLKSCRCTFYKQARFSAVRISDSRGLGRGGEIETDRQIYR